MKKFLILSIMILFLGSLMALESGPSETVGFVKYGLVADDYNMVGLPMEITFPIAGGSAMASDLATELGASNVDLILFWDTVSSGWKFYTGAVATDFAIQPGDALIVKTAVGGIVDFYSAGAVVADVPSTFAVDYNMLMVPLTESTITLASELKTSIESELGAGTVDLILFWDTVSSGWKFYTGAVATDYAIGIGDALMVQTNTAGSWNTTDVISGGKSPRIWNDTNNNSRSNNSEKKNVTNNRK